VQQSLLEAYSARDTFAGLSKAELVAWLGRIQNASSTVGVPAPEAVSPTPTIVAPGFCSLPTARRALSGRLFATPPQKQSAG
jgi:hypothetical protein